MLPSIKVRWHEGCNDKICTVCKFNNKNKTQISYILWREEYEPIKQMSYNKYFVREKKVHFQQKKTNHCISNF